MDKKDPILEYFLAKIELDESCRQMINDQIKYWKYNVLEDTMKSTDMRPDESCEEWLDRIQKENPKLMVAALQSAYMMVFKKLPTKDQLFEAWFQENCQSEELQLEYANCNLDLQQMGEATKTFRVWASEKFFHLLDSNQIDPETFDVEAFLGQSRR